MVFESVMGSDCCTPPGAKKRRVRYYESVYERRSVLTSSSYGYSVPIRTYDILWHFILRADRYQLVSYNTYLPYVVGRA